MQKVQNKKVINRLSSRTVAAKGKKNLVTIFAIMLTTVLFTTLFTIGNSMIQSFQESTMRQVGGKNMAGVKFILPQDYEILSKDLKVKNPSYRILVGNAVNEELMKVSTEVNYAEDENAKSTFCYPQEGTMPRKRLEVATSTLVLDALGIPHKVGEKIPLKIDIDGKHITEEFVLSGFWEGDTVAMAQECWISREYCDEVAPTPEKSHYDGERQKYAGYWMMDFDYANSWNIENKTIDLLERHGYDSNVISYGTNWAYMSADVDGQTIGFFGAFIGLIFASGYLIIYNIFSLNVTGDIKSYGLLKTIGTTEKQLKKLVRRQAGFLSAIGIPCGLLLGTVIGKWLFPIVVKNFELGSVVEFSVHPLVLLGAGAFAFFTVWISCNKPCKMAAKVSPVEAVRYTDSSSYHRKKERKVRKVNAPSFAWANLGRNRKKVVIVVASLSLSMILLNSVYTMIQGFDMDKYVGQSLVGDAIVTDASVLNLGTSERTFDGITPEIKKELETMDGILEVHNVYFTKCNVKLSQKAKEGFNSFVEKYPEYFAETYAQQELASLKEDVIPWNDVYGVDSWGMEQLGHYKGELDWEKFKTGNYCFINTFGLSWELEEPLLGMYCDVGDKLSIELPDGTMKEYEVMAIGDMPYPMTNRCFSFLGMQVILPQQECLKFMDSEGALMSVLIQEKDGTFSIDRALEQYTEQVHKNLISVSKTTYQEEFQDMVQMFWIVGGGLSLVLALIGILNFVNAIVTGILARKQELAMMEAVGMTGKQMKLMLSWEGVLYAVFTLVLSVTVGAFFDCFLLEKVAGEMWFFTNHFTIVPILLCMPILLLVSSIIPIVAYNHMKKTSVVERLRETCL